jgi:hypothetical protein
MPDDCDLIEFTEFPDDNYYTDSHNQVPVRNAFLAGAWAKGVNKHWIISASMKNPHNFYYGKMKVSSRELLEVFSHIDNGTLLKEGINKEIYPFERHTCFGLNKTWLPYSHC